jgi:Leucine-rich repeat (LRR) protein
MRISNHNLALARIEQALERNELSLDLSGLKLKALPYEIVQLSHLTALNISNNALTKLDVLSKLTQLKMLDLSNNQITDMSPLSQLIDLQRLNLNGNPLKNLSPLESLVQLEQLEISLAALVDVTPLTKLPLLKGTFDYRVSFGHYSLKFRFSFSEV